jgi:predicted SAM-dependent methyltransferase
VIAPRLRYILTTGWRRRVRDLALSLEGDDLFVVREDLARRYLRGSGIEIGPLAWPLRMPPGAHVSYVDRLSQAELVREQGVSLSASGLDPEAIPVIDVIDDAERLAKFADRSLDFVVANHVLEHVEDPISTLGTFLRVIRSGGILFLALPDARHTFDAARERTTVEHLLRDHREGPEVSRRAHYEEWARFNEQLAEERVASRVAEFERDRAHHHFHVWELDGFLDLLRSLELPCRLELAQANQHEFDVILRKR